ncbi:hypothetical protein JTB14_014641 [Gonioctena quinquepunctata]|nr:hypothetical protein JTB14_014641 [Gonioctena quinquepunctata]
MNAFFHDDIDLKIVEIELILPNGDSEMAYDGGGVLRDVLSEFWVQFHETCTIGTTFKIPYIRHDYDEREWSAIAKIFDNGWHATEYLPVELAPTFIMECLHQNVESDELVEKKSPLHI